MINDSKIEVEYLRSILYYNKNTGIFTWKINKSKRTKSGNIAGNENSRGYVRISINKRNYLAHRLAWLYVTGFLPDLQIDHINRIRNDNRFINLRLVTNKENQENVSIRKDNSSGTTGVHWRKDLQKWQVRIKHHGKRITIGVYSDLNSAKQARKEAELTYYTHKENS